VLCKLRIVGCHAHACREHVGEFSANLMPTACVGMAPCAAVPAAAKHICRAECGLSPAGIPRPIAGPGAAEAEFGPADKRELLQGIYPARSDGDVVGAFESQG
jgi:hypothetical protein